MQSMMQVTWSIFFFFVFVRVQHGGSDICRGGLNTRKYGNDLHQTILKRMVGIVAKKK